MRSSWRVPEQQLSLPPAFHLDKVLLEHDGPQMVTVRDGTGQLFLGVAADDSDQAIRWIYAPISKLELDSLFLGAVTTRDALFKDKVWIIDEKPDGTKLEAWTLSGGEIPQDALPEQHVLLPRTVRMAFSHESATSIARGFCFAGQAIQGTRISFRDLSFVTDSLQRLWSSFMHSTLGMRGRKGQFGQADKLAWMYVTAFSPGSFVLEVEPENETMFVRLAANYRELIAASDSIEELRIALGKFSARVASAYLSYLGELSKRDIEVLAILGPSSAFIAPSSARRIAPVVETALRTERSQFEEFGRFVGFSIEKGVFELYSADEDKVLSGTLSPQLRARLAEEPEDVRVGATFHSARLEIVTTWTAHLGATSSLSLLDYQEVSEGAGDEPLELGASPKPPAD
jgi:hypothetical protein